MFGANRTPIIHQHELHFQTDRNEIPHDPHHLAVPSGVAKTIFEPMVRSAQTVHLSCVKISRIHKQNKNELPRDARHLGVPSGASKTIPEPMVHLAQTVHLSSTDNNIVPKWTETRFAMTYVT
jgi:hypothetical protein